MVGLVPAIPMRRGQRLPDLSEIGRNKPDHGKSEGVRPEVSALVIHKSSWLVWVAGEKPARDFHFP
jgi:hypothetical protein